jgi:hypothetical protein
MTVYVDDMYREQAQQNKMADDTRAASQYDMEKLRAFAATILVQESVKDAQGNIIPIPMILRQMAFHALAPKGYIWETVQDANTRLAHYKGTPKS